MIEHWSDVVHIHKSEGEINDEDKDIRKQINKCLEPDKGRMTSNAGRGYGKLHSGHRQTVLPESKGTVSRNFQRFCCTQTCLKID